MAHAPCKKGSPKGPSSRPLHLERSRSGWRRITALNTIVKHSLPEILLPAPLPARVHGGRGGHVPEWILFLESTRARLCTPHRTASSPPPSASSAAAVTPDAIPRVTSWSEASARASNSPDSMPCRRQPAERATPSRPVMRRTPRHQLSRRARLGPTRVRYGEQGGTPLLGVHFRSKVLRTPDCRPGHRGGPDRSGSLRADGRRWQPPPSCSAPPSARPIGDAMACAMREPQRESVREDAWAPREHFCGVHPRARTEHRRMHGHASADHASLPGRSRPAKGWLVCQASVSLQVRVAWMWSMTTHIRC